MVVVVVYERACIRMPLQSIQWAFNFSVDEGPNKHKASGCAGQVCSPENRCRQLGYIYSLSIRSVSAHASYDYHTPESILLPQPWLCC